MKKMIFSVLMGFFVIVGTIGCGTWSMDSPEEAVALWDYGPGAIAEPDEFGQPGPNPGPKPSDPTPEPSPPGPDTGYPPIEN